MAKLKEMRLLALAVVIATTLAIALFVFGPRAVRAAESSQAVVLRSDLGASSNSIAINNTVLASLSTASFTSVQRLGYYVEGDAPPLNYIASASPCSLGGGAGDNGSQVRSSNGACWLANFPADGADIRQWGCSPSSSDNTDCLQAAIDSTQNGRLLIVGGPYLTGAVVANSPIEIVGMGGGQNVYKAACISGLRQKLANINLLTLSNGGTVRSLCIDQASGIANTSGAGIWSHTTASKSAQTRLYDNQVNGACFGIDITGDGNQQNLEAIAQGNVVRPAADNGCSGFRIGELSTGGATTDVRLTNNSVYCGENRGIALLMLDSGGLLMTGNVFGYRCNIGTYIFPGPRQSVLFTQAGIGPAGDTSNTHDLYIDTAAATATVFANHFIGSWASNSQKGATVYVRNSAGSPNLSGLYFRNFISYIGRGQVAFDLGGSWSNINIQDSTICASANAPAATGISIEGAVREVVITGNKIGGCDSFAGNTRLGTGVDISTSASDIGIISDNVFGSAVAPTTVPIKFAPTALPNTIHFVLGPNKGIADAVPLAIQSADHISLPIANIFLISGNATITNMTGALWDGRSVTLRLKSSGELTFSSDGRGAGRICNPVTIGRYQSVTGQFSAADNCWFLQGP